MAFGLTLTAAGAVEIEAAYQTGRLLILPPCLSAMVGA